ncbi:MAG: hypothetical protein IKO86_00430 [Prevotella sp.]|nr:hypothetical protein [Prevotella sp.]
MPPLFRADAFRYIVPGIPTNHARYSDECFQAFRRTSLKRPLFAKTSQRPIVPSSH